MSRFPVLPPLYYLDHFREMIAFVTAVYAEVLGEDERRFIADFDRLDETAQCLYVRMSNRKTAVFTADDLRYGELERIEDGLDALRAAGFLRDLERRDHLALLDGMTKPQLIELARRHDIAVRSSQAKPALVIQLYETLDFDEFACDLRDHVVPARRDALAFLLYLYFGKLSTNLQSFALRDLGVVSVRSREAFSARFADAAEARAGFAWSQALRAVKSGDPSAFERIAADALPPAVSDYTAALRDEALHLAGLHYERARDHATALAVYGRSTAFDSHERIVRILYNAGDHDAVKARLSAMMDAPAHDEEYIFAADFHARKFGHVRTGVFTGLLREAEEIVVDDLYRGHPEYAAFPHFEAQGFTCHHVENGLWSALFGLLFWDELFGAPDAYASAFDFVPRALKDRSFATRHAAAIAGKLDAVRSGQAQALISATVRRHAGEDNALFWWSAALPGVVERLLETAPRDGLAGLMEKMAHDWYALRDGFPDLMLTRGRELRFVEIKGEGDQVRRNQLARLKLLRDLGFDAGLCRVAYRTDPEQTYVVIDVETTGGKPPNDRVTEVGAVKIRGGEIVGEWQSLINPGRHIPAFITQLTGIDDAMVRDAPAFADIAEDLAEFLKGAVFVAHNVNFDYGFIASEFRRAGLPFRFPKLCTCASMRKYYPGHGSYGLKPLSREYGIRLDNHHRAMADARAAAELLLLVNERRLAA